MQAKDLQEGVTNCDDSLSPTHVLTMSSTKIEILRIVPKILLLT